MRYEAFEVNKIFNVGNEKAVLHGHVLNAFLQVVTYMLAKQTLLEAKSFAKPIFF